MFWIGIACLIGATVILIVDSYFLSDAKATYVKANDILLKAIEMQLKTGELSKEKADSYLKELNENKCIVGCPDCDGLYKGGKQ